MASVSISTAIAPVFAGERRLYPGRVSITADWLVSGPPKAGESERLAEGGNRQRGEQFRRGKICRHEEIRDFEPWIQGRPRIPS